MSSVTDQSTSLTTPDEVSTEAQSDVAPAAQQGNAFAPAVPSQAHEEEEEIASVKRVPEVTLHLWQNVLKNRGFEVQGGRLIRSPSKSQAASQPQLRETSPSRVAAANKLSRRGTFKDPEDDEGGYEVTKPPPPPRPLPKGTQPSLYHRVPQAYCVVSHGSSNIIDDAV